LQPFYFSHQQPKHPNPAHLTTKDEKGARILNQATPQTPTTSAHGADTKRKKQEEERGKDARTRKPVRTLNGMSLIHSFEKAHNRIRYDYNKDLTSTNRDYIHTYIHTYIYTYIVRDDNLLASLLGRHKKKKK
jgi:hypothetical protein